MPDKQKRRKNNKNKRKNKNQRPNPNTSSANANESVRSETCSGQNTAEGSINDNESVKSECEPVSVESFNEPQLDTTLNNHETDSKTEQKDLIDKTNDTQLPKDVPKNEIVEEFTKENLIVESYVVESPENSLKIKGKLDTQIKSKSLDNDDAPKIVEISEENIGHSEEENSVTLCESSNVLVTDVESDVEWEKTDDIKNDNVPALKELATSTLSIATLPFDIAECQQTKALTPEAEQSLRKYLKTLNLSTHPTDPSSIEIKTEIEHIINREIKHRLRKKGLADDFLCPRLGPPRVLDVIDEEGSSESSATSRRHSHLIEKKSDCEDLEDDVFEDNKKVKEKYSTKSVHTLSSIKQIPQQCFLVGAKIKEPEVTEARGDWSMQTVEKISGAEIVYLTDTSSSTSSIHDLGDETDDGIETDVSIRMVTPTIEVTDTENLLKKTFTENVIKVDNDSKKDTESHSEVKTNGNHDNSSVYSEGSVPSDHEIVVLSTDDIKTNLYVKEINDVQDKITESEITPIINVPNSSPSPQQRKSNEEYDIEMKVLKCELNDAINNLIKEVASDSESTNENPKESFARQDSTSSVCSSQCTAKYNLTFSSLNDVSNMHDETCENNKADITPLEKSMSTSHVKDVFDCVTGTASQIKSEDIKQPDGLRDLCVRKIATLPYGEKILEELASVSERLQNITVFGSKTSSGTIQEQSEKIFAKCNQTTENKMPYFPLPDVSTIETVSLETKPKDTFSPPVQPPPRRSSLRKSQDDHWTGLPTKTEPVYVCLSPSQKMLMEKTNTVISKENASDLVDMHKKFVDRRGYNECKNEDREKLSNPPVVPFKSQTGSRLLALIRDPTVTSSINNSISKSHHHSVDHIEKSYSRVEQMSKRIRDQFNSIGDFSSYKPIPPPRPRKYSSSVYESDESDFTDSSFRSMKSERKFFHYSTGNLNKEIENDISTIQNMHRHYTHIRDQTSSQQSPRRPSLPKDLCDQQMEYIRQKEKEVEAEIKRLEAKKVNSNATENKAPKAPLVTEKEVFEEKSDNNNYFRSHKKDVTYSTNVPDKGGKCKLSSAFSSSQEEILRDKMYSEYISQMAERQERKQHKVIKITNYPTTKPSNTVSKSMPVLDDIDSKVNNRIEKDFILKARERWEKLGIKDPETEDERETDKNVYREPKVIEHKIKVIEGNQEKDVQKLPTHLQEFVRFTAKDKPPGAAGDSGSGESPCAAPASTPEPPAPATAPHVVLCAVVFIVVAVLKYFIRKLRFNY
ncbi:hypothetical protein NE865_15882 [Phthorimaea operculella]|nr:hypothetical protein NE865_15882 [Phthorimaea operculella]